MSGHFEIKSIKTSKHSPSFLPGTIHDDILLCNSYDNIYAISPTKLTEFQERYEQIWSIWSLNSMFISFNSIILVIHYFFLTEKDSCWKRLPILSDDEPSNVATTNCCLLFYDNNIIFFADELLWKYSLKSNKWTIWNTVNNVELN